MSYWEGDQNVSILGAIWSGRWWKMTQRSHKWQTGDLRSSSHLPYAPKEGFETLHKQWMSLFAIQHPIYHFERVPQILYFVCQYQVLTSMWTGTVIPISIRPTMPTIYIVGGFETLHNQCLALFVVQHSIYDIDRVPHIIWYFGRDLREYRGEKLTQQDQKVADRYYQKLLPLVSCL